MVMLFVESVICVILGYGGFLVYQDKFNAGQLVEFIGYFNSIIWPVMAVADLVDMTSRGVASAKRIGELLDAPIDVKDASVVTECEPIKGNIEFRNLSFTFPDGDRDALKNMSAPHARVIRDGVEKIIASSELVPGDIIKLEAGDFVLESNLR